MAAHHTAVDVKQPCSLTIANLWFSCLNTCFEAQYLFFLGYKNTHQLSWLHMYVHVRIMKPQLTQSEEMGLFVVEKVLALLRLFGVFLLHLTRHWVSESDDEVNLGTHSTLVWTEHDGVWSLVVEFGLDGGGGGLRRKHQINN